MDVDKVSDDDFEECRKALDNLKAEIAKAFKLDKICAFITRKLNKDAS